MSEGGAFLQHGEETGLQVQRTTHVAAQTCHDGARTISIAESDPSSSAGVLPVHTERPSVSMTQSTNAANWTSNSFENCRLPASPLTESNRRPSPYHGHASPPWPHCLHQWHTGMLRTHSMHPGCTAPGPRLVPRPAASGSHITLGDGVQVTLGERRTATHGRARKRADYDAKETIQNTLTYGPLSQARRSGWPRRRIGVLGTAAAR